MGEFRTTSTRDDSSGYGFVLLVYGLYIARFFTAITLLVGVIVAYVLRGSASGLLRAHLDWLIRLFWWDVGMLVLSGVLFGGCFFIEPPGSSGWGQLVFLVPIVVFLIWNVVMLISLVFGLRELMRDRPPVGSRFGGGGS
ncbi:hypothetical protein WH240_02400 [Gluconobacter wancherniae]|uniref:hypothetical protein n=1 Tax=Gluconobacter wancherniae TaxID=1307955 RepID=UPI0030A17C43